MKHVSRCLISVLVFFLGHLALDYIMVGASRRLQLGASVLTGFVLGLIVYLLFSFFDTRKAKRDASQAAH
jgi:lipopolysaccharide export LptBFGC system permease protein LptF